VGSHWVKVKWSRYRPGVAQRVGRGIALLFHDRGTRRGWVVSSTSRSHFTPGKDPVPILQEAGLAPRPVWMGGKSRPHRDSIPDRPAHSHSLYRLSYPAHRSHWVLILLYLKNVLCCPEDDCLRSKHVAIMWPECIYNITVLIYSCVLTEYNTLCKLIRIDGQTWRSRRISKVFFEAKLKISLYSGQDISCVFFLEVLFSENGRAIEGEETGFYCVALRSIVIIVSHCTKLRSQPPYHANLQSFSPHDSAGCMRRTFDTLV